MPEASAVLVDLPGGRRTKTGLVSQSAKWWVPTLEEVLTIGDETLLTLPETDRAWDSKDEHGVEHGFYVNILYEGLYEETDAEDYGWEPSFTREPIETNDQIDAIKRYYGGVIDADGHIKFPETFTGSGSGAAGVGLSNGGQSGQKNPMFGVKDFLVFGAKFRRTYVRKKVPSGLLDNIGKVFKKIPGPFPTPDKRDWLFLPPPIRQVGNAYEIPEEYMLSAPGGWPKGVYGLIKI